MASWPVTGTLPASLLLLSTVTMPPAMVSLAEMTPSTLPPFWVNVCSKVVCATVASHLPVWSATIL